jgi:hypothetical protein
MAVGRILLEGRGKGGRTSQQPNWADAVSKRENVYRLLKESGKERHVTRGKVYVVA